MSENIESFIKTHTKRRDIYVDSKIDEAYIEPMAKSWKEYGIGKREILLLGVVIGYKLDKLGKIKDIPDCEGAWAAKGKKRDLGQLKDLFDEKAKAMILSTCIAKYGVDETISRFDEILDEIIELGEKGVTFIYCKLFKEFTLKSKQLEYIRDIDKLIED